MRKDAARQPLDDGSGLLVQAVALQGHEFALEPLLLPVQEEPARTADPPHELRHLHLVHLALVLEASLQVPPERSVQGRVVVAALDGVPELREHCIRAGLKEDARGVELLEEEAHRVRQLLEAHALVLVWSAVQVHAHEEDENVPEEVAGLIAQDEVALGAVRPVPDAEDVGL